MINIESLRNSLVGAAVRYVPGHAIIDNKVNAELCEFGIITSWNDTNIFVDYGNNCGRGVATSPRDLEFINHKLCEEHGAVLPATGRTCDFEGMANDLRDKLFDEQVKTAKLESERDRLLSLLRKYQWANPAINSDVPYCIACLEFERIGHTSDCAVGNALKDK